MKTTNLSILLTEDDADVAKYLTTVLESLGHRVVAVATDGGEAVELALRLFPDLVIMDIDLPTMSGSIAARKILEKNSVPVIISTGRSDNEALNSLSEVEYQACLIKPFSAVQLKSAIMVTLAQFERRVSDSRKIEELQGALEKGSGLSDAAVLTAERLFEIGLTRREAEVMHWVAQGKSNADVAMILESSPRTIAKHIEHVFMKLGVESRTAAVAEARRRLESRGVS